MVHSVPASMPTRKDVFAYSTWKRLFLVSLIGLTVMQQMPFLTVTQYEQIRLILYGLFGALSAFSILSNMRWLLKNYLVRWFSVAIAYSLLVGVFEGWIGNASFDNLGLLVSFGIFVCSLTTGFSQRQLDKVTFWYVLIVTLLAMATIYYYAGGFIIAEEYLIAGKNQVGPIVGIASLIVGLSIIDKRHRFYSDKYILVNICLFVMLFASLLVIRNRAGVVGLIAVVFVYLVTKLRIRLSLRNLIFTFSVLSVFGVLLLAGTFQNAISFVWQSLFAGFDVYDLNSVSAGRVSSYVYSLNFVSMHPIFGELGGAYFGYWYPHNYVLYQWVRLGVIGSVPVVGLYLRLWSMGFTTVLTNKSPISFSLPMWVLLFVLVVSNFEVTFPYGPGVSVVFLWFLVGQYFRRVALRD